MNFPTKTLDAIELILEFVELQKELISSFRDIFPNITDWETLLDLPRSGCVCNCGEKWEFKRHGLGICFTGHKSGKIVDVHIGMSADPKAFDSWRLSEYFDSIGIDKIDYFSEIFDVGDEDGVENLLDRLLNEGKIAIASNQPKLYKIKDRDLCSI